ncbi:SpoIIE family protein phosphatase [Streptomyces sp. NPDC001455]|uniref:SpoIIE family protein phosphatase n=1 Tax=unclassified Streptomyces TaxID=2593676 RepID=UPI00332A36BA
MIRPSATPGDRPDDLGGVFTATATVDDRGIVTGWSEDARLLLGYGSDEVVGRPAAGLLAEDVSGAVQRCGADGPGRNADGSGWNGRVTLRHHDGGRVEVGLLAHRGMTDGGAVEWFVVCAPAREACTLGEHVLLERAFAQSPYILAIYDTDLRSVRANAEMERAVAMTDDEMRGLRLSEIVPHPDAEKNERAMRRVLETGRRVYLENYLRVPGESREHAWSICVAPVVDSSHRMNGVCFTAHDMTKRYWARQRLLLINEAGTRIGRTLDVARTAQELADVAVPRLADCATVDLLSFLHGGEEPRPGPLTGPVSMRRTAVQCAGAVEAPARREYMVTYPDFSPPVQCLSTGRPSAYDTTDPLMARWAAHDPAWAAMMREQGVHSVMVAPIRARGITLGVAFFSRHQHPEPFEQDDILLAEEITTRAAVCIDNARRFTRERTTSVTLQRSLLPRELPEHVAVDVAFRYLPAGGSVGVGGDWFDVIPLSGARVALVVGDVVGHGLHASVTMGRLRTAVRTLADIDLPPDELLTHLDDLVVRLGSDDEAETVGDVGATCMYAVYDPVSRRCTLSAAGHPMPVVVPPGGTAELLEMPIGPPLGLGSLPFETAEVELPEGSLLAFYTDGLVESRNHDIDERIDTLRAAVSRTAPSLDEVCDTVLDALLPPQSDDDIALLLARTRALGPGQVAGWDIPAEPSAVASARQHAADQLAAWGLDEAVFTTELVVSELVTNAIRYGSPPIQLRLLFHDHTLICEVSDTSSTAPHMRRARVLDENGRGLLLVAQLTGHWGTRPTPHGKTIWAEQNVRAMAAGPSV